MRPFGEILAALAGLAPTVSGSAAEGARLVASQLAVELPMEARIGQGGELTASLPRGRLATGFDPLLGRVTARFEVVAP